MRLWLAWGFRIGRQHGSSPLLKRQLAEFAHFSDANRRRFSSFSGAWLTPTAQQRRAKPGANVVASPCSVGGHLLLKLAYKPLLESLRCFRDRRPGAGVDPRRKLNVHEAVPAWMPAEGPKRRRNRKRPGASVNPSYDKKSVFLAGPPDAKHAAKSKTDPLDVFVSAETWQLLKEYDILAALERVFGVHIQASETSSKQVQLTVHGRRAAKAARMLDVPPLKLDVPEEVCYWLTTKGPKGTRVTDIENKSGALVQKARDYKSVLLVGTPEATVAVKRVIGGLHIKRRRIPQAVYYWLTNKAKGAERAREMDLEGKFDTCISMREPSSDDLDSVVDLAVVGEREENVDDVLAIIDGLHVKRSQITRAVRCWLTHKEEGAECARETDIEMKFDACIITGEPSDDSDPASLVDLAVVGERVGNVDQVLAATGKLHAKHIQIPHAVRCWLTNKAEGAERARETDLELKFDACIVMGESSDVNDFASLVDLAVVGERVGNVDQLLAAISSIVVEKVNITELQGEFWMGHEDEQHRNRPHHRLHARLRKTECVKEAVKRIGTHVELRTTSGVLSRAAGNYVARIRDKFENDDDLQIHLRMRPGTCELRRLHRVNNEEDVTKVDVADQKLMREIDLHEVVLDVHESWERLIRAQCKDIEDDEGVGIGVSTAVNGRVLVTIAGSRTTVKQGTEEVIRMIASHRRYREGDIRLRRIEGQPVDTTGFEKAAPIRKEDLSNCREPFDWERLTHEQWRYTGRASTMRKRKQSASSKHHNTLRTQK